MTWTYSGDPTTDNKDAVRFLIGDVDSTDPQLDDEEILWLLSENNDSPYPAAVDAAENLVALYARMVNRTVGDLAVAAEARSAHYAALATRLKKRQEKLAPAGGIFIGNDQKQRLFSIGMHDHGNDETRTSSGYDDWPGDAN